MGIIAGFFMFVFLFIIIYAMFFIRFFQLVFSPTVSKARKIAASIVFMVFFVAFPIVLFTKPEAIKSLFYNLSNPRIIGEIFYSSLKVKFLNFISSDSFIIALFILFLLFFVLSVATGFLNFLLYRKFKNLSYLKNTAVSTVALVLFVFNAVCVLVSPYGLNAFENSKLVECLYAGHLGTLLLPSDNGDHYLVQGANILPYVKSYYLSIKKTKKEKLSDMPEDLRKKTIAEMKKHMKIKNEKIIQERNPEFIRRVAVFSESDIKNIFNEKASFVINVKDKDKDKINFSVAFTPKNTFPIPSSLSFGAPANIISDSNKYTAVSPLGCFLYLILTTVACIVSVVLFLKTFKTVSNYGATVKTIKPVVFPQ